MSKKYLKETSELDVCADQYHRYKEDIALMAEMGFKTYRFSIGQEFYLMELVKSIQKELNINNVINECLKYGIEPLVTMFHFDMPGCFR